MYVVAGTLQTWKPCRCSTNIIGDTPVTRKERPLPKLSSVYTVHSSRMQSHTHDILQRITCTSSTKEVTTTFVLVSCKDETPAGRIHYTVQACVYVSSHLLGTTSKERSPRVIDHFLSQRSQTAPLYAPTTPLPAISTPGVFRSSSVLLVAGCTEEKSSSPS